ncbi:MAG: thioredoxin family protein [Candidatus Omnitrophica bacterium]|nr:thioredoxin family protein [Candidatus Omnitrophota bacterium]MCM8829182.1 thioredoxin family protein [Candidatus Omnitrophota bacterium]
MKNNKFNISKAVLLAIIVIAAIILITINQRSKSGPYQTQNYPTNPEYVQDTQKDNQYQENLNVPTETPLKHQESKKGIPKIIDLGADRCVPCKMMAPILEEIKREYKGKFDVEVIDVWKHPETGDAYKIRLIPTQIFFDETGREIYRHEGFMSKQDILQKWTELGYRFEK